MEAPESHDAEKLSSFLDMQIGVPYTNAEINAQNYKSGVITKAEFVFDRMGLVSYSYDIDFRQPEPTGGALIVPSATVAGVPFAMNETTSAFKIGTPGGAAALEGVRKMTRHARAQDGDRPLVSRARRKVVAGVQRAGGHHLSRWRPTTPNRRKNVFATFLKNEARGNHRPGDRRGTSGPPATRTRSR